MDGQMHGENQAASQETARRTEAGMQAEVLPRRDPVGPVFTSEVIL